MKKYIFFLLLFIGIYISARMYISCHYPNSESASRASITITPGTTLKKIAKILEDNEIIKDAFSFQMYSRLKGLNSRYQAGDYIFSRNLTYAEIAEMLQNGKSKEIKITIPEGSTIAQIDKILAKNNLTEAGEFIKCTNFCDLGFRLPSLEGYLYASTYYVNPKNYSNKSFIQRLYKNFQIQLKPYLSKIRENSHTMEEIIIVASMIEREANLETEMPIISGIIWKRLREGIQLGIDATTRYELNNWTRALTTEDFAKNSPYNTRKNYGLPPTAISNPSMKAIEAALNPIKTEYYYYLHDPTGQIHYGKNAAEHTANKKAYLW